jgi:nitrogen fixation protein NifB
MAKVRAEVSKYMPQMHHCTRCRADAVGLLGEGISEKAVSLLRSIASGPINPEQDRPYVAVTSHEGMLVNQHLGEARNILVFGRDDSGRVHLVETRMAPAPGGGTKRWLALATLCSDCMALLTLEAGQSPTSTLAAAGLKVIQTDGIIEHVVDDIYRGRTVRSLPSRGCGNGCSGTGMGCA